MPATLPQVDEVIVFGYLNLITVGARHLAGKSEATAFASKDVM
jgi:hypothetical protein